MTALLTGDLQASGCVGTASRVIASQNVPVRTVIWLFKKPTFYVVARPEIKSAADLRGKTIGISSFGSDTDLAMKVFAQSGKLDPDKDIKRIVAGSTATRLQGLKAGSMDATTLSPPFNIYAEQMGLRVLAYIGDLSGISPERFHRFRCDAQEQARFDQTAAARHLARFAVHAEKSRRHGAFHRQGLQAARSGGR